MIGGLVPAFVLLSFVVPFGGAQGSACHTVMDGNWTDPEVWDCGCDPSVCDTIYVEHTISIEGFLTHPGFLLSVQTTGTLTSNDTIILLGDFHNLGQVFVHHLIQPQGVVRWINHGVYISDETRSWVDSALNTGQVHVFDTLDFGPSTQLENFAHMSGGFFWCGVTANFDSLVFEDAQPDFVLDNYAYFRVSGLAIGGATFYNEPGGYMDVDSLVIYSDLQNRSIVRCEHLLQFGSDFFGGDMMTFPLAARIDCGDLRNYGHIRGFGSICVADSSINYPGGIIDQAPALCDASLSATAVPFVDLNLGTIGTGVRWCEDAACATGVMLNEVLAHLSIYPVPSSIGAFVEVPQLVRGGVLQLFDMNGLLRHQERIEGNGPILIGRGALTSGVYHLRLLNDRGSLIGSGRVVFTDR